MMSDEEVPFQLAPVPWQDEDGAWRPKVRVYTEFPGEGLEEVILESRREVTFRDEVEARTYSERLGLKYLLDRAREAESEAMGAGSDAPTEPEGGSA